MYDLSQYVLLFFKLNMGYMKHAFQNVDMMACKKKLTETLSSPDCKQIIHWKKYTGSDFK